MPLGISHKAREAMKAVKKRPKVVVGKSEGTLKNLISAIM
jgi:hypothetical protein